MSLHHLGSVLLVRVNIGQGRRLNNDNSKFNLTNLKRGSHLDYAVLYKVSDRHLPLNSSFIWSCPSLAGKLCCIRILVNEYLIATGDNNKKARVN